MRAAIVTTADERRPGLGNELKRITRIAGPARIPIAETASAVNVMDIPNTR